MPFKSRKIVAYYRELCDNFHCALSGYKASSIKVADFGYLFPETLNPAGGLGKHTRRSINDAPLTSATGGAKYRESVQPLPLFAR